MSLEEFKKLLDEHDWHWYKDPTNQMGPINEQKLLTIAEDHGPMYLRAIYDKINEVIYND